MRYRPAGRSNQNLKVGAGGTAVNRAAILPPKADQ